MDKTYTSGKSAKWSSLLKPSRQKRRRSIRPNDCNNDENEEMIIAVKAIYNCVKTPEKNSGLQRGLNPWPAITGAMLYQLSYEATDVGCRSIVGSYVPVKEMSVKKRSS